MGNKESKERNVTNGTTLASIQQKELSSSDRDRLISEAKQVSSPLYYSYNVLNFKDSLTNTQSN